MNTITELNSFAAISIDYTDQALGSRTLVDQFQINGLLDTAKPVMDNIEKICSASASWLSFDIHEGKWGVVINKASSTVAIFNDSNILGNISISGTGIQDLYNSVKVEFPHRELRDSSDFVKADILAADRNNNEEDNTLNLTYDIINDPVQAQYLGMIELKQSRVNLIVKFQTDFTYINLKAGELIQVTDSRTGFNLKPFRIITVTELQDDNGSLIAEITALEYSSSVYATDDLYKYTRSDSNGIITIGSIGVPGIPTVSKVEVDARPHVILSGTTPTGIVEGLEFWLSTDISLTEANRSYKLIATKTPDTGVYTNGTTVTVDYDSIGTANFLIKTRGYNSTIVGPYSDPSGFVYFAPVQTTDAIDQNTTMMDSTGAILTALTVLDLLKSVDGIWTGVTGAGSLYKSIFDLFATDTGTDLIGLFKTGSTNLEILDHGTTISTATSSINFTGSEVELTRSFNDVGINIEAWQRKAAGTGISETWATDTANSTTEVYTVEGIDVERFTSITFTRENGYKVKMNITWP